MLILAVRYKNRDSIELYNVQKNVLHCETSVCALLYYIS